MDAITEDHADADQGTGTGPALLTDGQLDEASAGLAVAVVRSPVEIEIGGKGGCQACCSGLPRDVLQMSAITQPALGS